MDYMEIADYLYDNYTKLGWLQTQYIIFDENNIIKYLKLKGYLNDNCYRNLIYYQEEYYVSKRCWNHIIRTCKSNGENIRNIINNL